MLKALLPRSLLGRSLLIIVMPLLIVQIVSAYIFYGRHWEVVTRHQSYALTGDIATIIAYRRRHPGKENHAWILRQAARRMRLDVSFEPGARIDPPANRDLSGPMERNLAEALDNTLDRAWRMEPWKLEERVAIDIQLADGVLHVLAYRKRLYSSTTYVFILWMVGTSLLVFGIAVLFMRNQVRAVKRLAAAADAYGKGRDTPVFKPHGALEVRQAATAFNLMRERIDRQISQRTEMLAGVSHDLRTPLTRMKLQLAMLEGREGAADLRQDVHEMERMVEGYLAFARGEGTEQPATTDITGLLDEVVDGFRREGEAVDLHTEEAISLPVRPEALRRCLNNLVANAVRFAGHVAVRAGTRRGGVEVTVDDDGPGIPSAQRDDAFRAFFRLDESRNPRTGGTGLGLTVARDVVRGHGGDISLEDSPLGGLRVRLYLPY